MTIVTKTVLTKLTVRMKKTTLFITLITSMFLTGLVHAQQAQYPIVKDFGGIYEVPGGVNPDTEIQYKLVIDLKSGQADKEKINRGLNNVARMMNLHGLGGVQENNLHVVVVAHDGATETILNNDAYRKKNGVDNPNLPLIEALEAAGANIYVCGQSLLGRRYDHSEVNEKVTIGLSMLTVVTEHMHKGYKQLVFN